jgi:hypothetical protein
MVAASCGARVGDRLIFTLPLILDRGRLLQLVSCRSRRRSRRTSQYAVAMRPRVPRLAAKHYQDDRGSARSSSTPVEIRDPQTHRPAKPPGSR